MKAHILIVEDDPSLSELLQYNLDNSGFRASVVSEGDEAINAILTEEPDLVILDWMLPNLSGIEICRQIRQNNDTKRMPIIMLTAKGEESERIRGLETGADDYVTKPVVPKELAARVRAHLRRAQLQNVSIGSGPSEIMGDIDLRREQGLVFKGGQELSLTKTEFNLLCEFADHPNVVLSRDQLLERVWGYDYLGDSRLVDAHVRRLRVKIEDHPDDPKLIVTVRGIGYRLMPTG